MSSELGLFLSSELGKSLNKFRKERMKHRAQSWLTASYRITELEVGYLLGLVAGWQKHKAGGYIAGQAELCWRSLVRTGVSDFLL